MKTLAVGDNSLTISDNSLTIVDAAELSVCVHLRHWTSPTHQTGGPPSSKLRLGWEPPPPSTTCLPWTWPPSSGVAPREWSTLGKNTEIEGYGHCHG